LFLTPFSGYIRAIIVCVFLSIRSNSLFTQWVCLELNILCFIPLLVRNLRERSILRGVKYFISQRLASLVFILGLLIINKRVLADSLVILALVFKLGVPPFHSWLIRILTTIGYSRILLVFTVQKFLPLFIISQVAVIRVWIWIILVSLIVIISLSINRVARFYILLIFSGAINRIWIVRRVSKGGNWVLFLIVYFTTLSGLLATLSKFRVIKINDRINVGWAGSLVLGFHLLNLGGLPPLVGFLIKLRLIKPLILYSISLRVGLVISSLVVLYLYIVFCYHVFSVPKNGESNQSTQLSNPSLIVSRATVAGSFLWLWLL